MLLIGSRPDKDQDKKPGDDKKKPNERSDKDGKKDDEGANPDKDKDLALSAGDLSVAVLLRALKEMWAVIDCIRETGCATCSTLFIFLGPTKPALVSLSVRHIVSPPLLHFVSIDDVRFANNNVV